MNDGIESNCYTCRFAKKLRHSNSVVCRWQGMVPIPVWMYPADQRTVCIIDTHHCLCWESIEQKEGGKK